MTDVSAAIRNDLSRLVDGQVHVDDASRALYSTAACTFETEPLGVIMPRHRKDVVRVVDYCRKHAISITGRGAGSSVAGQAIGPGLILDMTRHMNRILRIDRNHRTARVQPGLKLRHLNERLRGDRLHFAPDPSSGSFCSIGGMINTNAGGVHSVRYGTTRDNLRSLRVVLDNAEEALLKRVGASRGRLGSIARRIMSLVRAHDAVITDGRPLAPKNSSGYHVYDIVEGSRVDLHRLYSGSEGTLAVLTEATLELHPIPRSRRLAVLGYPESEAACDRVEPILELKPSALELLDETTVRILLGYSPEARAAFGGQGAYLLVEFDNAPKKIQKLRRMARARSFKAPPPKQAAEIWMLRKLVSPALERRPGPKRSTRVVEDVCVDPGRVGEYLGVLKRILRQYGFEAAIFGHAGSGNIHVNLFVDTRDPGEMQKIQVFALQVYRAVKKLRGTMSGEHGDGLLRAPYMREFFGDLYPVFESVKQIFDPAGLFNPGKILTQKGYRFVQDFRPARRPPHVPFTEARLGPIEEALDQCNGCAKCHTYCPVYEEDPTEFASPRGKVNLLVAAGQNRLPLADLMVDKPFMRDLQACEGCRLCLSACPAGTDLPAIADALCNPADDKG